MGDSPPLTHAECERGLPSKLRRPPREFAVSAVGAQDKIQVALQRNPAAKRPLRPIPRQLHGLGEPEAMRRAADARCQKVESITYRCCRPLERVSAEQELTFEECHPPPTPPLAERARAFAFKLDPFQEAAIACLHRRENVLVSAHTSAGKTVVAQYAMAMAQQANQRVIYTTPIKALSNQKFRDLGESIALDMPDASMSMGLMTGDCTVNPEATCLVMTTEILRSMLYRGADEIREVSWVVFDEVHYLRDKERGVVWEESIILLPPQINLVFLSATIPNAREFAQWVAELKQAPCHVITTDYRPTPLQHYMFPSGGRGLYLVLDEAQEFLEDNFSRMIATMAEDKENKRLGGLRGARRAQPDIQRVVKCIVEHKLEPAIVFAFSRKECEALALQLTRSGRFHMTSAEEQQAIEDVFSQAMECLTSEDQALPQIQMMLPLLRQGFGVHHSGLLPILRELIEILFQEGLLRVLFATETFALGLNMPARTCVFTNCRKFDGHEHRCITCSEYIQMAGRAGRRSIDDKGFVITMFDEQLDPQIARSIVCGESNPLRSTFHLTYNMLLNATLNSGGDISPETVISKSFHHYQSAMVRQHDAARGQINDLKRRIAELDDAGDAVSKDDTGEAEEFLGLVELRQHLESDVSAYVQHQDLCLKYLVPGRVVRVVEEAQERCDAGGEDWGWGVVVSWDKRRGSKAEEGEVIEGHCMQNGSHEWVVVNVLVAAKVIGADEDLGVEEGRRKRKRKAGAVEGGPEVDLEEDEEALLDISAFNWWLLEAEGGVGAERGDPAWRPVVLPMLLSCIRGLSSVRVKLPAAKAGMRVDDIQREVVASVMRAAVILRGGGAPGAGGGSREWQRALPLLDFAAEGGDMKALLLQLQEVDIKIRSSPWHGDYLQMLRGVEGGARIAVLKHAREKVKLQQALDEVYAELRSMRGQHSFTRELKGRMRVLRRLGYLSEDDVVTTKGRAACEVEMLQDLVVVEMMMQGAFNGLGPPQLAAVCSCLIAEEKDETAGHTQELELRAVLAVMRDCRRMVHAAQREAGLIEAGEEKVDSVNASMMDLVHMWCSGAAFADVCSKSKLFEGSIIRMLRREAELLMQLQASAAAIGDTGLESSFKETLSVLQRGLPFSASLYL